jgi:hypothetical protein
MPRIIVTTDTVSSDLTNDTPVLMDEHVHSVHLSTSHAAAQLMERLAWAVRDAESTPESTQDTERPSGHARPERPQRRRRSAGREHARGVVAA